MRHPGEVLTRTKILDHAWDYGADTLSNVVDQYVGYLRRKIDRPFGMAQLETVRGAGYRLRTISFSEG
jgi:two-component system OmpR family response regulator